VTEGKYRKPLLHLIGRRKVPRGKTWNFYVFAFQHKR
jgi:hypothetical protein